MRTLTSTRTFLLHFATLAALCLTTLTAASQTDFPANFLGMDRSGLVTMEMKMVFWSSAEGYTSSTPLSYVQVDVSDSYARDYSALAGSNEFSMNFNDQIVDYTSTAPSSKPARIGILELKENPGGAFQVAVDRGKTSLCFPLGYETGEEELRNLVRLVRTKDGLLAAMVTFNDTEGIFTSLQPGIRERICMVLPLQDSDPTKSLKLFRDKEGNSFALLLLRDGNSRAKMTGSGKANLGVNILTPSDKAMAEKIGMTLVVVK